MTRNVRVLLAEVDADRRRGAGRCISRTGIRLPMTILIVGTGASHTYFGHPEWGAHARKD